MHALTMQKNPPRLVGKLFSSGWERGIHVSKITVMGNEFRATIRIHHYRRQQGYR